MKNKVRVAGIQMDCKLLDKSANMQSIKDKMELVAGQGAELLIFPECIITGYIFNSLDEAIPVSETIPGPCTDEISSLCRRLNVFAVFGIIEKDKDKYYNAAAFIGPHGLIGKHRKLHLPGAGIDKFCDHGDISLRVYDTDAGRIGLGICYDGYFPEHARVLALEGAEIVALPTAWGEGFEIFPKYFVPTRAMENYVYYAAVNRVGKERGTTFIGRSKIAWWKGKFLADGKAYEEDLLCADIEPALARQKCWSDEKTWLHIIGERRPEFYGNLTVSNNPLRRRKQIK